MGRDSFWQRDKGSVIGWLKMVVRQQAYEVLRRKSSGEVACCDMETDEQPSLRFADKFSHSSRWPEDYFPSLIQRLLTVLPKQAALVIQLTLKGYSNKEIACELGISLATISRHCQLARETIEDVDFGLAA